MSNIILLSTISSIRTVSHPFLNQVSGLVVTCLPLDWKVVGLSGKNIKWFLSTTQEPFSELTLSVMTPRCVNYELPYTLHGFFRLDVAPSTLSQSVLQ